MSATGKQTAAERLDRQVLYQLAVQDPVTPSINLMKRTYRRLNRTLPKALREDFCGTGLLVLEWVRQHPTHTAIGIDLDADVLAWANTHYIPQMTEEQLGRARLVEQNVLDPVEGQADLICAFNFSYLIFKQRDELKRYFEHARSGLAPGGLLFLDLFGGPEALGRIEEETEVRMEPEDADSPLLGHLLEIDAPSYTYTWEQSHFNPVNHDIHCAIHFEFEDGSELRDAFNYEWRLYSIPELRDILIEAGFSNVEVHWEEHDEDGDFIGYRTSEVIDDDDCFLVFLSASA